MKKTIRIVLIVLAAALLLGFAALAAGAASSAGTEDDPLVTLSYINDVFLPYVQDLFHKDLEEKESALQDALEQRVSALEEAGVGGSGEYVVETLEAGQTLICQRGAELMLRIGRGAVTAEHTPGLVDTATTENLNDGEELIVNHMYMVTINGHGVRALETVKILVRGDYTIS